MDFQNDHLEDSSGFKIASILDEHTRLILDRLALQRGLPAFLRMDNGPEMACNAVVGWADGVVGLVFIPLGEPWKNGYVESFHSRQRDEYVNINAFAPLLQARVELADWHHEYNHVRRHSSLGYKTGAEYAAPAPAPKPTDSQSDQTENTGQATARTAKFIRQSAAGVRPPGGRCQGVHQPS